MPYYAFAPENDAKVRLVRGTHVAVFNDRSDPDYVGMLTEISGLDSPEVRESAEDLTQSDGGVHGDFYYGRRPIVLTGKVIGPTTVAQRNVMIDKMLRASNAMRQDATIEITSRTVPDAPTLFTTVRRQQPPRVTGGWVKDFQIPLVSEYAPLFNLAQTVRSGLAGSTDGTATHVLENQGSGRSHPIIRIFGIGTNPYVENTTTGEIVRTTGVTLSATTDYIEIDTLNHTAVLNGAAANDKIDFGASSAIWPSVVMGNNTFRLVNGGSMTITYRDTWQNGE